MKRYVLTAGLLVRRDVRRALLRMGLDFTEEKGWLESEFYFGATQKELADIIRVTGINAA